MRAAAETRKPRIDADPLAAAAACLPPRMAPAPGDAQGGEAKRLGDLDVLSR